VTYGAINLSNAMTIASEALRHYPRNHTSLTQNYTIINYRSRGISYDQAKLFKLFDKN
ncbi:6675_t:CDS:1, partial [Rhizophagus irregularis]